MSYESIKFIHILSATFVLTSMSYSFYLWRHMAFADTSIELSQQIQRQTWRVIIPCILIQLVTGFVMLNLKEEDFSQFWIQGSILSFVIAIASWFGFIYFLLCEQQELAQKGIRRVQASLLFFCTLALLSMIFFMANKVVY